MLKTVLSLLPALAIIIFIGSHRSSLFGTAKYQLVGEQLLAGHDYYGNIDFDERAFQKLMAERLPRDIKTLIVGSSRTMQLDGKCFEGPFYNASVSGAMLSDVAATLEQFRRHQTLEHVIIAADPWMLSAHEQSAAWTNSPAFPNLIRIQAAPDWIGAQLRLGLTPHWKDFVAAGRARLDPMHELLAPATFHSALDSSKEPTANAFRKRPNGALDYPATTPSAQDPAVLKTAEEHMAQTYAGFDRIDPFLARTFEALTNQLQHDGVRVTLVLAPFHPLYYDRASRILRMTESYYRKLNLETRGTYSPVGIQPIELLDAVHVRKDTLERLCGCPT